MLNLSITACSFSLKKINTRNTSGIINLNHQIPIINTKTGQEKYIENAFELFKDFININSEIINDKENQRIFNCTYNKDEYIEEEDFIMYPILIKSGIYGSSSDIINVNTQELQYQKKSSDADFRQFYLTIVIPKDNPKITVQKGLLIFQDIGPYGVKTVTTKRMQQFFSEKYRITMNCNTIAPSLFINKVLTEESLKQIQMIKNYTSSDEADNINIGYGQEVRIIGKLNFKEERMQKLLNSLKYVSGAKNRVLEFEEIKYDKIKAIVEIGGKKRTYNLSNMENVSIIEPLPEDIRENDGNPNKEKLMDYEKKVIAEYLNEMVLQF